MNNLKGFSILRVLIVVGIFVALVVGVVFLTYNIERREIEQAIEQAIERRIEWREKPAEKRGEIIRSILLARIEEESKNIPQLEEKLAEIKLDPQKTEIWIRDLGFIFVLIGKETTEAEIRECCEKELEKYLKILELQRRIE